MKGNDRLRTLLQAMGRLARWQKLVIGALVLLVVLTWLAACLVFASYLAS